MADARAKKISELSITNTLAANDLFVVERYVSNTTTTTNAVSYSTLFASVPLNQVAVLIGNTLNVASNNTSNVTWLTINKTTNKSGSISFSATDSSNSSLDIISFGQFHYAYLPASNTVQVNTTFNQTIGSNQIVVNTSPIISGNNLVFSFSRSSNTTANVLVNYTGTLFTV